MTRISTRLPAMFAMLAALSVAACGFRPLYGDNSAAGKPSVQADLGQVAITPIRSRTGQILRNHLIDRMNPSGQPGSAGAYTLIIRLGVRKQELGIRRDETATRANLIMTVNYVLVEQASGAVIHRGISRAVTSYNILDDEFATLIAEKDARARGAEELADDITTQMALYFNRTKRPVAGK